MDGAEMRSQPDAGKGAEVKTGLRKKGKKD
jgi:hypothetical protein